LSTIPASGLREHRRIERGIELMGVAVDREVAATPAMARLLAGANSG